MKTKLLTACLLILCLTSMAVCASATDGYVPEKPSNLIVSVKGEVTGDKSPDAIAIYGVKVKDSQYVEKITLVVTDGKSGKKTRLALEGGYGPTVFLGDFTGDGADDILVQVASGGSGGLVYGSIYSFAGGKPKLIFSTEAYDEAYTYDVTYEDGYKVKVVSNANDTVYTIDISGKGKEYLDAIYDKDGKLKEPIQGAYDGASLIAPIRNGDDTYRLLIFQSIWGQYHADSLGYVENFMRYEDGKFVLDWQYIGILPNSEE